MAADEAAGKHLEELARESVECHVGVAAEGPAWGPAEAMILPASYDD